MAKNGVGSEILSLSPDDVFVTRSVSEVIDLNKKIQYEIERKREDLRAMVGERYRELIHAADTIGAMKSTTERTIQHLGTTVALCRTLHESHLIGFRIPEKDSYSERNDTKLAAHSVGAHVKLLLEIPENVWWCIDREHLLRATQIYIFARHVNTGLQLLAGSKQHQAAIQPLRSLIDRQWTSVSNLHSVIEQSSRDKLQHVELKEEIACSCLLSLHLLDPRSTLLDLLKTFISLHGDSGLIRTLDAPEQGGAKEIGASIVNSAKLVLRTIQLVQSCFVEKDGGSVVSGMMELYHKESPPLIHLLQLEDAVLRLLPKPITTYRLTTNKPIQPISKQDVSACVAAWMRTVQSCINSKVKPLLQNINNAKTLQQIREQALKIETPTNWNNICESLSMPSIDVWSHYFQSLLTARVKEIIDTKWRIVTDTFETQIINDLKRVSSEDCEEKESDLNWFVWRDVIGETVIESRDEVVDTMNSLIKGMRLQDRGVTPTLERMCRSIDNELLKLLTDVGNYLHDDDATTAVLPEDDTRADRTELQIYLRDVADRSVACMLRFIKDECLENCTGQTTEMQLKTTAIYTARFVQAVAHLMPHLRTCYTHGRARDAYQPDEGDGLKRWNAMCSRLKESYLYCWGKWVDIAMRDVERLSDGLPNTFTVEANIDYLLVQWDVIKIDQLDEEGQPVDTIVKIPAGPSLKLQEYLYSVARVLDQVLPHALPREVHTDFIARVAAITLTHFDKVIREHEADINQRCALQLLADVKYTTLLLVPRENRKCVELSREVCERLKKTIDPFDHDVFYPHIQTNVKRSVQRVQTLLGSLIGDMEQVSSSLGDKVITSGGSADKSPMLLACPSEPRDWLSLLPVTAPTPNVRKDNMRKKVGGVPPGGASSSPARTTAGDVTLMMTSSLSGAKSGAAAFFGDWFGTS